jgi:hypothetical protein
MGVNASRKMRWAVYVAHMESMRNDYTVVVGKLLRRTFERHVYRGG